MEVTLKQMVSCLRDLRASRKSLEDKIDTIKATEKDLSDRILMEMAAQGLKSLNIEGVARIAARDTYRYEFADIEKFAQAQFDNMLRAVHDGRPLVDALLFQQRMSKSNFEDMMAHRHPEGTDEEALDRFGVRKVEEKTLSLTKA